MLSLSERKIEHRRVTSSVTKDFTNPILVWPGESDESIKEEEEEEEDESSRRVRYISYFSLLIQTKTNTQTHARAQFRKYP